MFGVIKKLFGNKTDYVQLIQDGAIIVDVRSPGEYKQGHVEGSINIPLDRIKKSIPKFKKRNKAVITCCASGMRSGSASSQLKANGIECYNGGPWQKVARAVNNSK